MKKFYCELISRDIFETAGVRMFRNYHTAFRNLNCRLRVKKEIDNYMNGATMNGVKSCSCDEKSFHPGLLKYLK